MSKDLQRNSEENLGKKSVDAGYADPPGVML